MDRWTEKRILILGTTYPSYSTKYTESVCTGGIEEDTLKMVRLYPIPHRYLDSEQRFHAFQWIKVKVTRSGSDPRPESWKVDKASIQVMELLKDHGKRRTILESSPHFVQSVEELKERQRADATSLGIIIPKTIDGVSIDKRSPKERKEWLDKERELLSRGSLYGEEVKPLDFLEVKFCVSWHCADDRCAGHKMNLHQWGIHELYRKYKDDPDCYQKVIDAMYKKLDQKEKDVFLFLGSFSSRQYNFGLMDSYPAPARPTRERDSSLLFDL